MKHLLRWLMGGMLMLTAVGCMTDDQRSQWIQEGKEARELLKQYQTALAESQATIREAQAEQDAGTLDPAAASVLIAQAKEQGVTYAKLITSTKDQAARFENLSRGKTWSEVGEGIGWSLLGNSPYAAALLALIRVWRGPSSGKHKDGEGRLKDTGRVSNSGIPGASGSRERGGAG